MWFGKCGSHAVQVLIDIGSTYNFHQHKVAKRLGLPLFPTMPSVVYIGNGDIIDWTKQCLQVSIPSDRTFLIDFYIPPIHGSDLVLGVKWLELFG